MLKGVVLQADQLQTFRLDGTNDGRELGQCQEDSLCSSILTVLLLGFYLVLSFGIYSFFYFSFCLSFYV